MGIIWWSVESMVMIIIYCYFIILSDSHIFILLFIFWTSFTHKLFFVDSIRYRTNDGELETKGGLGLNDGLMLNLLALSLGGWVFGSVN